MIRTTCTSRRARRGAHRPLALAALSATVALAVLTGCATSTPRSGAPTAEKPAEATATAFPATMTDDMDRTVTVKTEPKRIVSLAPGNTEILFALGLGDRVVGVTSYDDYPAEVADIAKVGDFAGPNLEAVAAADPDLVVATTGVQADVIGKLEKLGATVVALDPQSLDGLYADIAELGTITGRADEAATVVDSMKSDISDIAEAVSESEPSDRLHRDRPEPAVHRRCRHASRRARQGGGRYQRRCRAGLRPLLDRAARQVGSGRLPRDQGFVLESGGHRVACRLQGPCRCQERPHRDPRRQPGLASGTPRGRGTAPDRRGPASRGFRSVAVKR